MAIDIYISINNSEEVMHIPVTPPEISITSPQGTETFETSGYGLVRIIGCRELRGISWESFFPVHDYPFRRDNSMKGQEYANKIENWRKRKLPIRLVITSTGLFANLDVNIACAISQLDGRVGTNGDYNYSIQFDEVDLLNYTLNEEELTVKQYEELIQRLEAVEKRLNDIEGAITYNYVNDDMPEWARPTIQKLINKGCLSGVDENELGLTLEMMRTLVIIDRTGAFD